MREYSLYLFDFDNTLFDTSYGIEMILRAGLPVIGLEYEKGDFVKYLGMSIDDIYDLFARDGSSYDRYVNSVYSAVNSDAYKESVPFPETVSVLRTLKDKGKHIGIVSGKKAYKIEYLMKQNGMEDIPETIVGWDDTEKHKPNPEPVALAFSRFRVPIQDALFIGDSSSDSGAAEAFGMDCAIVNRHNGMGVDGLPCRYQIESLKELLDWRSER